ncbi:MAG: acyl-CoA thioesterase [Elainellaceae cyanobacterium]
MFRYTRTLFLHDTDAAGVAYFASLLSICHEAYEASLTAAGAPLAQLLATPEVAIPIIEASARFLLPLRCGDRCEVQLVPQGWQTHRFIVSYELYLTSPGAAEPGAAGTGAAALAATALTQHYCIHAGTRQRQSLPPSLQRWYQLWAEPETGTDGAEA